MSSVCMKRSDRLWSLGQRDLPTPNDLGGGRLLAYIPAENLRHGVAEWESKGFLDGDDIPPYDTWVWFARETETFSDGEALEAGYLVAWVPPDFIDGVHRGIEADPAPCIAWLDTLDTPLVISLRRLGLLSRNTEIAGSADAR